ncbi:MAG: GspH/FimT family pseudopilin [Rubrivivax sp.]
MFKPPTTHPAAPRGVSLIETAVVLAIVAVLVGAAAPGFQELRQRRQLDGVAALLETDLQLARTEAVARNESVRVGFVPDPGGGSCYVLHTGPVGGCVCDAQGVSTCGAGAIALRSVPLAAGFPVRLESNSASIVFDAAKGTVTPTASIQLHSPVGQLRQIVNVMGRVRTCTPDGVSGHRAC